MNKGKSQFKIALLGNMNNNNFALMRYFIDLGYDANLILFTNDCSGNSKHFEPICDTWDLGKWEKYIVKTNISDNPTSIFELPLSLFLFLFYYFRYLLNNKNKFYFPISKKNIRTTFSNYTHFIGSGTTPSILNRVKTRLTVFYPYSGGVEWLGEPIILQKKYNSNFIERLLINKVITKQLSGLRNTKNIISPELYTKYVYDKYKLKSIFLMCPLVYNLEILPHILENSKFDKVLNRINTSDFSILSHSRHLWKNTNNYTLDDWKLFDKNNDWYINSFSQFTKLGYSSEPLLILFEYGDDVLHSKKLIEELGISKYIIWLTKSDRKEIMWLLSNVDVGIGEFYDLPNILFGGTGYEVLASGKPLIQGFNFIDNKFEEIYGIPPPPLLRVTNASDITNHFINLAKDKSLVSKIGSESKKWFDNYCGIGLAKKWVNLFTNETI
jgi:hypothetical protein